MGIKSKSGIALSLLALAVVASASAQTGDLDPPLVLEVESRYVGQTASSTFNLVGPPRTQYRLEAADLPAEVETSWGTSFLDIATSTIEATGTLSALGEATVEITHPADRTDGTLRFFQARGKNGQILGVSNSIAVRFGEAPEGKRKPEAIAATADGTRAYVAHALDGTLSVIDAVNDTLLFDMPVTAEPPFAASQRLDLSIDPEGRHLFLVNPLLPYVTVLDIASNSISGQIPVPLSSRSVTFNFVGPKRLVQITNEAARAILIFRENPEGRFTASLSVPLQGDGPGPAVVMPNHDVLVAHRGTLELEQVKVVGPKPGSVNRYPLGSAPNDLFVVGSRAFVATFSPTPPRDEGRNELVEVSLLSGRILNRHLVDHGTDYFDTLLSENHVIVLGTGSGAVVVGDPVTFEFQDLVELAPGDPTAIPSQAAIVADPVTGAPDKLYVVNLFRETVRPIDLSAGAPFPLQPEIVLAYKGSPRVPLRDLRLFENGEWFFHAVDFFNGTTTTPNMTTCNTCHPRGFSDGILWEGIQAQELFDGGPTGPWRFEGTTITLDIFTQQAFDKHGLVGGEIDPNALVATTFYQEHSIPLPLSPFRLPDGTLTDEARAGKAIFDGIAGCRECHAPPLFIPRATSTPEERNIEEGVGTGLAPANVPSLRGKWATAPHLHNGSAPTLMDVLLMNVDDLHGATSTLTQEQLDNLVAYLLSL